MSNEEKILEMLMAMRSDITEIKAEMDKQFDKVDKRLEDVDKRFDKVDERLEDVDKRFDKVDERLEDMDKHFDKVDERLEDMDKRFDKVDERLEDVDKRLEDMDKRFDKVDERLEDVDKRLEELDARSLKSAVLLETDVPHDIHLLYEGHSEIVRKLDTLATKEQVDELASDVDVIKIVVSGHSVDIGKLKKAL